MINLHRGYCYFRVPKAANTFVVANLLKNHEGVPRILSRSDVEAYKMNGCARPSEVFVDSSSLEKELNSFYKFSMVRNPYSRFLSAYFEKIVPRKARLRQKVLTYLGKSKDSEVTLDQFADYLEKGDGIRQDAHWARQIDVICMPVERLDYVAKVEAAGEGMSIVLGRVFDTPQAIEAFAPHATNASDAIDSIDYAMRERIYRVYEEDFTVLRYSR
jgi:hypothetical protein